MFNNKRSSAAGTGQSSSMLVKRDYESGKKSYREVIIFVVKPCNNQTKQDEEFTKIENNKELADIQATNILSQGLPRHVFNILNQTRTGKEIWDNVELLMKGLISSAEVSRTYRYYKTRESIQTHKLCELIAPCIVHFVPQKEIVPREQVYWLPTEELLLDREHSKVVELEAEILKKQQMLNESEKHCAFIEKNHVALISRPLETELTQLKDAITSVRIQNDGFKVENKNVKRRYKELSETITHSRFTFTAKINALTVENSKTKNELSAKEDSGSTSEKPKVLASGMYTNSSKYVPPPKRANWVKPTPLPKNKQVTFQEPPRTSNTQQTPPVATKHEGLNVPVNCPTTNQICHLNFAKPSSPKRPHSEPSYLAQ
ncbi:hypothetical protein Tco_0830451 [Tanacetum coccineum]